jgi:hypothetical protein
MKKLIIKVSLLVALCSIIFTGCEDKIDPVVEEMELDRELAPIGLQAAVRNQTTIELNWTVQENIDHYVVEFSEDSLEFNTIIRTITVLPEELPVQESFFGDTRYSARVKAVGATGSNDSKWAAVTIRTSPENIFLPITVNQDIEIFEATLKWPAGEEATRFVINPGAIERTITAGEVANGEATISGLDYYTAYSVIMYAGNSQRGNTEFKTLMNPDCASCVKLNPGEDVSDAVDAAASGSIIVLAPGIYPEQGSIAITKSVTLQGAVYYDLPAIYGQLTCATAVTSLEVKDVVFRGDTGTPQAAFFNTVAGCNLTNFSIANSEIRNYSNSLISNNASGTFGTITISDSYIHSITGGGGDGIDFRGGVIGSLTVENSTFANGFRTFLRMQVACNTMFKNCTFYKISNLDNSNNHGLFRANVGGTFEVRNCLFAETGVQAPLNATAGNFCRQASNMLATPTYANNNIHSCYNLLVGLYTSASQINATELNPGFVNAAGDDFTITNQTLIDNAVGDPRWRP